MYILLNVILIQKLKYDIRIHTTIKFIIRENAFSRDK